MIRKLPVILMLLLLTPAAFGAEYPWEPKKDSDGIQVHVRKVEGSPILEYKGRMVIEAGVNETAAFYEDAARAPEWFHQCEASRLLEEEAPDRKVLYFLINLPWPVHDRDAVYRRVRETDPGTGSVSFILSAVPDYDLQVPEGVVRMPALKGLWRFTPLEDGKTEVYYQQHGDVGGSIPAVLVNKLAVNIPYNSLKAFRKILMEEKR